MRAREQKEKEERMEVAESTRRFETCETIGTRHLQADQIIHTTYRIVIAA